MKKLSSLLIGLALAFLFVCPAYPGGHGNTTNQSFNKAKKILEREVYKDHRTTFYCGCPFDSNGSMSCRLMHLVRASRNGETAIRNVLTVRVSRSKEETAPER